MSLENNSSSQEEKRAVNSVGECLLDVEEAAGPNPARPT